MKKLALVYDDRCMLHMAPASAAREGYGDDYHPENPKRFKAIINYLEEKSFLDRVDIYKPDEATDEQILAIHSEDHFGLVKRIVSSGGGMLDADTFTNSDSLTSALLAAGAAIKAADLVIEGKNKYAFSIMRPPGHHAESDKPMGFCLFNNVAVAVKHTQSKGIKKAAVLDWDVHHGNGTQEIFYHSSDVLFISLHQHPFYPGTGSKGETGAGEGKGFTINYPLPAGTGSKDYQKIFKEEITNHLKNFQPEILFISAGFDAHKDDPLAQMELTEEDFAEFTRVAKSYCDENNIGIVSVLEGGYNLDALPRSVYAHLEVLV